jgi:hypothetical protein
MRGTEIEKQSVTNGQATGWRTTRPGKTDHRISAVAMLINQVIGDLQDASRSNKKAI